MRKLSNALLHAAVFTRRVPPIFQGFINLAFKVRAWELKHWASPEEVAQREVEKAKEKRDRVIRQSIRKRMKQLIESARYDQEIEAPAEFLFKRHLLNGSFKVTPALRALVKKGVKQRRENGVKGPIICVANKTNTAVSLGLGQIGDRGGVVIPKPQIGCPPDPFFLTDHATKDQWLKSSDFRRAIAQGWITLLPTATR